MRTIPFLTALFAVALVSGAALAEKPQPRGAVDRLRARGDVVDRIQRADRHVAPRAPQRASNPMRHLPDRAASRVSCSDTSVDCPAATRVARGDTLAASGRNEGRAARPPAFLEKILGNERTSFNEAGEDQGMSSRAVKRVWARAAMDVESSAPRAPKQARSELEPSKNRVACNEGDPCGMSSKAAKKEWSNQATKAGTGRAPEAKQPSPAERAIAAWKAEQSVKPEDAKHRR